MQCTIMPIPYSFYAIFLYAVVAQWIEYLASNQGVAGSIPADRTIRLRSSQAQNFAHGLRPRLCLVLRPLKGVECPERT